MDMKQLHVQQTSKPIDKSDLTNKGKAEVLESNIFLKVNRDINIKERTVVDRNRQWGFVWKEDASSQKVATETVSLTSLIYTQEGKYVVLIDIPYTFTPQKA